MVPAIQSSIVQAIGQMDNSPPDGEELSRLSPLVMGGAGFSYQLHPNPESLPVRNIVRRAFELGLRTIDTSPYYEPSEQLLGAALSDPEICSKYRRNDYILMTKVGRIAEKHFDYSPGWIRKSVARSLQRLGTTYLDVVFCHDVEFVNIDEAVEAVGILQELSRNGVVKYVGVSGYDIERLEAVSLGARQRFGDPVDVVQSWGKLTLQNTELEKKGLEAFRKAGVKAVCSSSPLAIGLLRNDGVPVGALGNFHPAPAGLRAAAQIAACWVRSEGDDLASLALRFSISRAMQNCQPGFIVTTITGIGSISDLEENVKTAKQILKVSRPPTTEDMSSIIQPFYNYDCIDETMAKRDEPLYSTVRNILGRWLDYDFSSTPPTNDLQPI